MPIEVTVDDVPITVSASGTAVQATVSGGQGPQGPAGPQGPPGDTLPSATEGQVLTYVSGQWIGAEPTGGGGGQPDAHAATHGEGGSDPVTVAGSQISGGALPSNATLTFSDGTNDAEIGGWGFGVEVSADGNIYATVEPSAVTVHGSAGYAALQSQAVYFSNGTSLTVGTFDSGRSGASGISLVCAVGYELNWQAGYLKCINANGTTRNILVESPLEFPGEGTDNVQIDATGITFADGSQQTVAYDGTVPAHAASHAAGGADQLFDQGLNTTDDVSFNTITATYGGTLYSDNGGQVAVEIDTGTVVVTGYDLSSNVVSLTIGPTTIAFPNAVTFDGNYDSLGSKPTLGTAAAASTSDFAAASHNHAASAINSGTLDIARIPTGTSSATVCIGNDSRLSDARTPTSHVHGNITNAGAIGSTSGLPIITTTSGVLTTGAFGTSAGQFCQGNDARLSDTRTPTAGSVTDSSIASGGLSASSINWVAIQPWAANTAYAKGDLVSYLGVAYRRSSQGTSGSVFSLSSWQQIAPSEFVGSQITSGTLANARLTTRARASMNLYLWSAFR